MTLDRDDVDTSVLAAAWTERYKMLEHEDLKPGSVGDSLFWAYEMLDKLCRRNPELAWQVILEIASRETNDFVLDNLSAGPLEDLLSHHGKEFIERIEEAAGRLPTVRRLISGVWRSDIDEEVWVRLKELE